MAGEVVVRFVGFSADWEADIPEFPDYRIRAKTLDEARAKVVEALSNLLDVPTAEVRIHENVMFERIECPCCSLRGMRLLYGRRNFRRMIARGRLP